MGCIHSPRPLKKLAFAAFLPPAAVPPCEAAALFRRRFFCVRFPEPSSSSLSSSSPLPAPRLAAGCFSSSSPSSPSSSLKYAMSHSLTVLSWDCDDGQKHHRARGASQQRGEGCRELLPFFTKGGTRTALATVLPSADRASRSTGQSECSPTMPVWCMHELAEAACAAHAQKGTHPASCLGGC